MQPVKNTSGRGFAFEDQVGAFIAAAMLAGKPLLDPSWGPPHRVDFQVGQDGWVLDDLLVTFRADNRRRRWAASVKSFVYIGGTAPRAFVQAAWEEIACESRFDRSVDHIGVVTAPLDRNVKNDLDELVRLASEQSPRDLAARMATKGVSRRRRELWESFAPKDDLELPDGICDSPGEVLGRLRHLELDFERPNSADLARGLDWCGDALADDATARRQELWATLLQLVNTVRTAGGYLDYERLSARLSPTLRLRPAARTSAAAEARRLLERSRQRLTEGWRAAGVDEDTAAQLADDEALGAPTAALPKRGVVVIEGDWGAGKSVAAERTHQRDLRAFLKADAAPLPVHLRARDIPLGLEEAVAASTAGLGESGQRGATVVLDGLDEVGHRRGNQLLRDARVLVNTLPETRVVITTRPAFELRESEKLTLAPLSDQEVAELSVRLTGRPHALHGLPEPVREAVRRPLFAIIALTRHESAGELPSSRALMLDDLVRRALADDRDDVLAATETLARAASTTLEAGGQAPERELGGPDAVARLLETRQVVRGSQGIRFSLPVVEQYFAAYALTREHVDPLPIVADLQRFELWRYAFVVAVGIGTWDQSERLLTMLGDHWPGAAAWVVREAVSSRSTYERPLPQALISAEQMAHSLALWLRWLEPASRRSGLTRVGTVKPLPVGALVTDDWFVAGLIRSDNEPSSALELPPDFHPFACHHDPPVVPARGGRPPADEPAWPWRWTLQWAGEALTRLLENYAFVDAASPLASERTWALARHLVGESGRLNHAPIARERVREAAARLLGSHSFETVRFKGRSVSFSRDEVEAILDDADARSGDFTRPWVVPDNLEDRSGWVSGLYTTRTTMQLIEQVYSAALCGYVDIVQRWLPRWGPTLGWAAIMPIHLDIVFQSPRKDAPGIPVITVHEIPLPVGAQPQVTIREADDTDEERLFDPDLPRERTARMQALHPMSAAWGRLSIFQTVVEVHGDTPATGLAFEWLGQDLKKVGLLEQAPQLSR